MGFTRFQSTAGSAARTLRPRQSSVTIHRPRVVELLEARSAAAVCVVRGPRNSGKSVALQQWAGATNKATVWLMLNEQNCSVELFWQHLAAAIGVHTGRESLLADIPWLLVDPILAISTELAGEPHVSIIVENFQLVQDTRLEHELALLLERAPELSLIISTRSAPDLERLQVSWNLDVLAIDSDDLAFTAAEAAEFHAGTPLQAISAELNEHFKGIPPLHKSAKLVANDPIPPAATLAGHIVARVTDQVRRETLASRHQTMTPEVTRLLAATLPLDHFDMALLGVLLPDLDLQPTVTALFENNLLSVANTASGIQYRYRPIIKNVCTSILAPEIAAAKEQVLSCATTFELNRKEYAPAFAYAMASQDYRLCSTILLRSGLKLFADSERVLHRTLPQIPKTQLVKFPLLTVALAVIYNGDKASRIKALEHFALALTATTLLGKSVPQEERLAVALTRVVALRMTGQFKLAASGARKALKNLNELSLADQDKLRIFETIAVGQWGLSLMHVGDYEAATTALKHSVFAGEEANSAQAKYFATSLLAYRYAVDGDLKTASLHAAEATELFADTAIMELYQQTPLHLALAIIELGRLDPDAAARYLDKVISETDTSEFWGRLRIVEAQIDLLRGHAGIASGRLGVALARKKNLPALNPVDAAALSSMQAELLLASGNATGAAAALDKLSAKNPWSMLARARLSLAMGQPADVVELLSAQIPLDTMQQELAAQILLTVAMLHLQPKASLRPELERISGALSALQNQWPLAMLTAPDLELLLTSAQHLGVPFPQFTLTPTALIPASLQAVTLTPRETSILTTLATTGDRNEIARINFVSVNTVKSQLRTLYKKLGVTSREDALLVAHREQLLNRLPQE